MNVNINDLLINQYNIIKVNKLEKHEEIKKFYINCFYCFLRHMLRLHSLIIFLVTKLQIHHFGLQSKINFSCMELAIYRARLAKIQNDCANE